MKATPSESAGDGRDSRGRFAAGNGYGQGNPHARQVQKLRAATLKAVTEDDVRAVINTLLEQAKQGNVMAAREFLDRTVGKVMDTQTPVAINLVENLLAINQRDRILLESPEARELAGRWQDLLDGRDQLENGSQ